MYLSAVVLSFSSSGANCPEIGRGGDCPDIRGKLYGANCPRGDLSGYPLNETSKEIIHLKKGNITGINDHKGCISRPTWMYEENWVLRSLTATEIILYLHDIPCHQDLPQH